MTEQQYIPNSLALVEVDGEPRVRDLVLAERLEFADRYMIRKLIKRNHDKLLKFGIVYTMETIHDGAGRPTAEFYLNQRQAIFICMKSETERAFDVQAEIVRVFDAYLKGESAPPVFHIPKTFSEALRLAADTQEKLEATEKELAEERLKKEQAEQAVLEAQPAVQFQQETQKAESELNIDETCAVLFNGSVPAKQLRNWLKLNHWMDARPGMNKPTAWAMRQGLMRLRISPPINGRIFEVPTMTGKGINLLRHLYRTNELFVYSVPIERRLAAPDYPV